MSLQPPATVAAPRAVRIALYPTNEPAGRCRAARRGGAGPDTQGANVGRIWARLPGCAARGGDVEMRLHGSKYGGSGTVDGCQILFCGAQALGMADIGNAEWVEKGFDYENQQGISTGKILGFLKPQFTTQYSGGTKEDFGVLSIYTAQ